MKDKRVAASELLTGPVMTAMPTPGSRRDRDCIDALEMRSLRQDFVLRAGHGAPPGRSNLRWNLNLAEIARIWKGGCIIRAELLDPIRPRSGTIPT